MNELREFTSAAELRAFYADLRERMQNLPPPIPKPVPVVVERVPQPFPFMRLHLERFPVKRTPMERIIIACSQQFGIPVSAMKSAKRTAEVTLARSVAFYIARQLLNISTTKIGQLCGGRDHTTVIHALRSVGRRMAGNEVFASTVENLIKQVLEEE